MVLEWAVWSLLPGWFALRRPPAASRTPSVLGVVSPVGQVDLRRAGDDQLQLPGVEHRHQSHVHHLPDTDRLVVPQRAIWTGLCCYGPVRRPRARCYLIEASDQALRLLGHASLDSPLDHSLDVLLLVLLRHGDGGSSWLQLPLCNLEKVAHQS